jgi:hypothetical protein
MKRVFIVLLSIFLFGPVYANLGDNENKINASYGKRMQRVPRADGTVSNLYEKGNYILFVIFLKGVSVFEMYARANRTDLSSNEITTFLKANRGGATWWPVNKGAERRFERSDHKAEATYVRLAGRPTLTVRLRSK